jgi:mannitol/fructose-specific phosphotransferase system IIA component
MNAICLGPRSKSKVRKEIVAGDDRIGCLHGMGEPPGSRAAVRAALGVGIAIEHGVVKVEHQVAGSPAQRVQLPPRQQFPLQDHGVIVFGAVDLNRPEHGSVIQALTRESATRGCECRLERSNAVTAADVVEVFDQGE